MTKVVKEGKLVMFFIKTTACAILGSASNLKETNTKGGAQQSQLAAQTQKWTSCSTSENNTRIFSKEIT